MVTQRKIYKCRTKFYITLKAYTIRHTKFQYYWPLISQNVLYNMSHVIRKPVMPYANNKGVDQPAHPRSLISTFVVRSLDSIVSLVSVSEILRLWLASVSEQARFKSIQVANPEDGFSRDEVHVLVGMMDILVSWPGSFCIFSFPHPVQVSQHVIFFYASKTHRYVFSVW